MSEAETTPRKLPGGPARLAGDASAADLQEQVLERLTPHLGDIIDDFYERIGRDHAVRAVVERLTADQFADLKRRQAEHLRLLLAPGVGEATRHERSRAIGRAHARVGVEMDVYTSALADHRRGVLRALELYAADLDLDRANLLLSERFMTDLHGALLGFRDLDAALNRVVLRTMTAVSSARTVADLARGLVGALATFEGISVALFARADANGELQYETGSGPGVERFLAQSEKGHAPISTSDQHKTGLGPMGRAWRSGEVKCCDSWQTDPSMEPWRPLATMMRWGSSASIPLVDRQGRTRAMISLQAHGTGAFAASGRRAMLEQVKQMAEQALVDLEVLPTLASAVSNHADRQAHLAGLASGRVEMLFQPVIALPSGRLHRLEALARLQGPDRLISPAEFLPAFGDDELFDLFEIGLHQSIAAMREWEAAGLRTDVSLNLPVSATVDGRYVRLVRDILGGHGVDPGRVTLELLETGFADSDMARRRQFIDDLREVGVRLAQDDLGSGYSSLLRLRHFHFDDVKIDQSLVRGTELSPGAALHFIQPISDIAHSQGLSVVIEGLEDDGLIEAAVQLGVDGGQGYGIARPMRRGDVVGWERDYRLELDPLRPRTAIGALAGHVAWERRVRALPDLSRRDQVLDLDSCTLTPYLRSRGDVEAVEAHGEAHAADVTGRGGPERRAAWERLLALVSR